ncbi:MAG TPA: NAD(P)-binding protein [Leptospiraceae bacterium]|nr:NAD(P)-binding protein [Leptospiraceae bacterium]HNH06874.1 NAD(P)-binding protein [Leptospiraceae bacterium]HNM05852.1 NAD(P)-binding protein [Leptospiraceae bacterium]
MSQETVIILGAGPAGLAAAYKILKNSKKKVIVIDKAKVPGGSGASFQWKNHVLDYGPHAFHTRGDEPELLIRDLFKDSPDHLTNGIKKVSIYLKRKIFKYPLQVKQALLKFNPLLSLRIMIEFALTSIFHGIVSIPIESFENWGKKRFGSTLYKISFGDYTEKVWKTHPNKISTKFASEKIQGFSFINLIQKLLRIGGQVTEPYYQTWIYHRKGSGQLYIKMAEEIKKLGGEILLETNIKFIEMKDHRFASIAFEKDNAAKSLPIDFLINSIQIPAFVNLIKGNLPYSVQFSSKKLRYISLILVYLEFETDKISDNHWFYLLENNFASNRVTEQKNLSPETIESGKTVLSFEVTCHLGDETWQKSDKELIDLVIKDCEGINFLQDKIPKISDTLVKRVPNVYEIYYKQFDSHANLLFSYLNEFENFVTVGRRGLFLQGDMHQAVEMGLNIASIASKDSIDKKEIEGFYKKYLKYIDIF